MQIFVMCVIRVLDVSILIAEQVHDACNWNILGMCVEPRLHEAFKVAGNSFYNKLSAIYKMSHLTSCAITYSQT